MEQQADSPLSHIYDSKGNVKLGANIAEQNIIDIINYIGQRISAKYNEGKLQEKERIMRILVDNFVDQKFGERTVEDEYENVVPLERDLDTTLENIMSRFRQQREKKDRDAEIRMLTVMSAVALAVLGIGWWAEHKTWSFGGGDSFDNNLVPAPNYVSGGAGYEFDEISVDTELRSYIYWRIIYVLVILVLVISILLMLRAPTKRVTTAEISLSERSNNLNATIDDMLLYTDFATTEQIEYVDAEIAKLDKLLGKRMDDADASTVEIAKYTDRETSGSRSPKQSAKARLLQLKNRLGTIIVRAQTEGNNQVLISACKYIENSVEKLKLPKPKPTAKDDDEPGSGRIIPTHLYDVMEMRQNITDPDYIDDSDRYTWSKTSHSKNTISDNMLIKKSFRPNPGPVRLLTVKSHTRAL